MYKTEKTCGSVLFIRKNGIKNYLLIKNDSGHIGFPKGHIEENETEKQTAEREVLEETGLVIDVDVKTRQYYSYIKDNEVLKHCVYFCNEFFTDNIKLQENEVFGSWLVPYNEAMELLNYPQDKVILKKADKMYD